jgi:hypothetical protein
MLIYIPLTETKPLAKDQSFEYMLKFSKLTIVITIKGTTLVIRAFEKMK